MRTIFAILAAISALICLVFVGATVATLGHAKTIGLGHSDQNTYQLRLDGLEMDYDGRVTKIGDIGSKGASTTKSSIAGVEITHQHREADARLGFTVADGLVMAVPSVYPILLFAILPLAWIVGKMGGKKKAPPAAPAAE